MASGTHKSNYQLPANLTGMEGWRNLQKGVHPIVQRVGGKAGSAIIFTEALTCVRQRSQRRPVAFFSQLVAGCRHGTLPWTGKGERRTLFMKISPHPLSWAAGYFYTEGKEWESELTVKQRMILDPPSVPGSQRLNEFKREQAENGAKL